MRSEEAQGLSRLSTLQLKSLPLNHFLLVLLVAGVSVFLLFLAWPRLHASLLYLPVDTAISNYWDSAELPPHQVKALQARAAECIKIHPHYRYSNGLSLLYFIEGADEEGTLYERRLAFENTIESAQNSLRRAPSQPRAWLRIARSKAWLRYPATEVVEAWKMAVYTGRVDLSLFMARLSLALSYLQHMDDEGRSMMRDQALLAWKLEPRKVTAAVKNGIIRFEWLEDLLAGAQDGVLEEIRESTGGPVR